VIVDSACYREGRRQHVEPGTLDLAALRTGSLPGDFLWMGLHEPDAQEMKKVAAMFALHPLAVEDSLTNHQRPKVEPYDDMLFVVLKTLWYVEERDQVETGQVSVFLGRDFVVTVRQGSGLSLASVRADLEAREHLLAFGPAAVAYAVCDRIVDGYEEVAAELENDVDEVEASVFAPDRKPATRDTQRIYVLKREVAEFRRAVQPLRVPMQRFAGAAYPFVPTESANFFRDVADHVTRVSEVVENLDMLLSTAFDAHQTRISVQQNEDMRKISAWVAIAAVGTLVAGIYGMNFDHMPELHWHYGYAWALGLMATASMLLYRVFKRSGWL
jgi:magnesium transporter